VIFALTVTKPPEELLIVDVVPPVVLMFQLPVPDESEMVVVVAPASIVFDVFSVVRVLPARSSV
jgi:hypothetical protein